MSTEDQAVRGFSLEGQREAIARYAEGRGWSVARFYIDAGASAYTDDPRKRPQFAALLDAVGRREWDAAIVLKIDRLARSVRVAVDALGHCRDHACALVSVSEGWDFGSISGQFLYHIMSALAQMESATNSERVRRGMAVRAARGMWQGTVPWGAALAGGRLAVDPARADRLAWLLDALRTEATATVARDLTEAGERTARGNIWRPASLDQWLRHADWLLGQPEPWPSRLVAARARPRRAHTRHDRPTYDLTGIMRCACGGRIAAGGRSAQAGGVFQAIRCHHFTPARPTGAGCPHQHTHRQHYEAAATAWLMALPDLSDEALVDGDDDAAVAGRRADIARRRRLLGLALADDALDEGTYRQRLAALAAEEARMPPPRSAIQGLGAGIRLAQQYWDTTLPPARNAFYRRLVEHFLITGKRIEAVPRPALATLLAAHRAREGPA